MQKAGDCGDISPQILLDFPQIFRLRTQINTATKPSPEVAPSKMEISPFQMEVAPFFVDFHHFLSIFTIFIDFHDLRTFVVNRES